MNWQVLRPGRMNAVGRGRPGASNGAPGAFSSVAGLLGVRRVVEPERLGKTMHRAGATLRAAATIILTSGVNPLEALRKNRSVMPLDAFGSTRNTLDGSSKQGGE